MECSIASGGIINLVAHLRCLLGFSSSLCLQYNPVQQQIRLTATTGSLSAFGLVALYSPAVLTSFKVFQPSSGGHKLSTQLLLDACRSRDGGLVERLTILFQPTKIIITAFAKEEKTLIHKLLFEATDFLLAPALPSSHPSMVGKLSVMPGRWLEALEQMVPGLISDLIISVSANTIHLAAHSSRHAVQTSLEANDHQSSIISEAFAVSLSFPELRAILQLACKLSSLLEIEFFRVNPSTAIVQIGLPPATGIRSEFILSARPVDHLPSAIDADDDALPLEFIDCPQDEKIVYDFDSFEDDEDFGIAATPDPDNY